MPVRRPDFAAQSDRGDILRKMIGSRLAFAGEGRIGRNRLDPQQRKQPLEAVVEIRVDALEDLLKLCGVGHFRSSLCWRECFLTLLYGTRPDTDKEPASAPIPKFANYRGCELRDQRSTRNYRIP